ncbi:MULTISPECIES: 4Fe-4S dicluster domain-containing protein [Desulfococcus]|jgi:NAD-dependent dihydropyrimidine dehydrogenase PreA subunit|uniref:4Fe-4S ferredoxin, iron-sulpur binding domain-containing protein n=1 Tax=Desulfococcus multivorans DSM 2059 TaxID=1121405 RepID=S7V4P2_DESML|nr:ferredoxin family protein [Desulfococcus multivorans]AOY58570.1 4Fe-4S ferredoxin, iron-sulpur binding domain protein [Desulfococcus multivorans]AQV00876.1 4Fe-4S ferredoxin [Desulfococcus multivorans]EPR41579.1 4Fe-4S ferredoxin, iron-sulpur binding domain-containing protein [Desulfococcus multivorans DSM 2059]MDX9817869.1 ferredoxin family protein [Desulfococcus multivorans]SJZ43553.1 4Fe-4S dicluster domain-containing protein [Desulfococcus multivorans DSM 2059]
MTTFTWQGSDVTIHVDYDACKGDGQCMESCPSDVYELKDGKSLPADIDNCIGCCTCVEVCPENAIVHSVCN